MSDQSQAGRDKTMLSAAMKELGNDFGRSKREVADDVFNSSTKRFNRARQAVNIDPDDILVVYGYHNGETLWYEARNPNDAIFPMQQSLLRIRTELTNHRVVIEKAMRIAVAATPEDEATITLGLERLKDFLERDLPRMMAATSKVTGPEPVTAV